MQIKDKAREYDGERQELVLTITASAEEVKQSADKFFKEIAQRDIPGFRKGKAPRAILEQSVGGHANAMGGVAEMLINELAFAAIDGSDTIFIDEPQFNVDEAVEEGRPFTFTVSGPVAPIMELSSYEPVAIEMPPEEATEAEIDSQIEELRDYYHHFEEITDPEHEAADGDYIMAVITIDNHGKVITGLNNVSRMIGLGTGTMPASFDEHMIGAKVGELREFDFEAKGSDGTVDPKFGDGELHATVEIKSFRTRIIPEVDDELAAKVGCVDVDDMRKQLRRTINVQKSKELPKLMVDRAVEVLIGRLTSEVPEYYVDFIRQDVGRELVHTLEKQGTNLQQWMLDNSVQADQMKEDVSREASRRAAIDCALEALFVNKGLEITDEDIDKMFEGEDDGMDTREAWEKANRMSDIRKMCRQSKATQWLVDNADVTVVEDGVAQSGEADGAAAASE